MTPCREVVGEGGEEEEEDEEEVEEEEEEEEEEDDADEDAMVGRGARVRAACLVWDPDDYGFERMSERRRIDQGSIWRIINLPTRV